MNVLLMPFMFLINIYSCLLEIFGQTSGLRNVACYTLASCRVAVVCVCVFMCAFDCVI